MKKQKAINLIQQEQEKGKAKEEIVEILMSQDKIGNAKPTIELVESLFAEQADGDTPSDDPDNDKQHTEGLVVYEKWEVNSTGEPVKKIKTVRIPDHVAEIMNRAKMEGRGYTVKYIKK